MLPNYLVIGAPKCGTSSLCHLLGRHPQVFMARPKEIHFFGRDDPQKTLAWYESFFADAQGRTAVGEGSTSYSHPEIIEMAASAIAELIPACRLIYMVREPLARLESDWKMRRQDGWTATSINEAIEQQPSLITLGLYWKNLGVYRRHFPDEQILVVFLEDFQRDPHAELRRCWEHLGVDAEVCMDEADRPRNAASGYRRYSAVAQRLRRDPRLIAAKRWLPRWAVGLGKTMLGSRVRFDPVWDPSVRAAVAAGYSQDSRRLLEFCGKSPEFWNGGRAPASGGDRG